MLDWRIDLQHQDDDLAGVLKASTCMAVSLMRTSLLDGVCWSCKSLLAAGSALSTGEGAPRVKVFTPVGDAIGVIWLSLPVGDSKSHRPLRVLPCLLLPFPIVGHITSRTLSKWEVGRLISARCELMLSEWGDLERCLVLCTCFGVIMVLVGFSLEIPACIVISMVEGYQNGSTYNKEMSRIAIRNIENTPSVWSLALLRHGHPILAVPTRLRRAGMVIVCCCSCVFNLI
jgi:hypothetical protein